jgi:DNA gyrase subunit B
VTSAAKSSTTKVAIREFVRYLNRSKTSIHESIFWFREERDGVGLEIALQWNDSYAETMY